MLNQPAPDFNGTDQNGEPVALSDYRGKNLVLYFYPKDDTPGCTAEACNYRDNYQSLLSKGYEVVGVSVDDQKSHQKFIRKYDLPFKLISDTDKTISEAYGVWVEKNLYGRKYMGVARTTFVIDKDGVVRAIIEKVDNENASAQVLEAVGAQS